MDGDLIQQLNLVYNVMLELNLAKLAVKIPLQPYVILHSIKKYHKEIVHVLKDKEYRLIKYHVEHVQIIVKVVVNLMYVSLVMIYIHLLELAVVLIVLQINISKQLTQQMIVEFYKPHLVSIVINCAPDV